MRARSRVLTGTPWFPVTMFLFQFHILYRAFVMKDVKWGHNKLFWRLAEVQLKF